MRNSCKHEYVFKRLVDYINGIPNGPKISTSSARELRRLVHQSMLTSMIQQEPEKYMRRPGMTPAEQMAVDNALVTANPFVESSGTDMMTHIISVFNRPEYNYVTGVAELGDACVDPDTGAIRPEFENLIAGFENEFEASYSSGVLPLSPYDVSLGSRDAFMDAGVDCLYTSVADVENNITSRPLTQLLSMDAVKLYRDPNDIGHDNDPADRKALYPNKASTPADEYGFSRLRQYLSTEDYRAVTNVMNSPRWNMTSSIYVENGRRVDMAGVQAEINAIRTSRESVAKRITDMQAKIARESNLSNRAEYVGKLNELNAKLAKLDNLLPGPEDIQNGRLVKAEARYRQAYLSRISEMRRNGGDHGSARGGQVALERAEAILKSLTEAGVPFEVKTNSFDGQVILRFENKSELRLIDMAHPQFSGTRMYRDGRQLFLKCDKRAYDPRVAYELANAMAPGESYEIVSDTGEDRFETVGVKSTPQFVPHLNASPDECVAFVKYALGDQVKQFGREDKFIGEPGRAIDGIPMSAHTLDEKHFYADMGTSVGADGRGHAICVDYNLEERSASEISIPPDGMTARARIEEAINSAKNNYAEAVDIDGLVAMFKEMREAGDEDAVPTFHSDDIVKTAQRDYWNILSGAQESLLRPGRGTQFDDGDAISDNTYPIVHDDETGIDYFERDGQRFRMTVDPDNPDEIPEGRIELLKAHLEDTLKEEFGSFEKSESGKRFNPARVVRYMDSPDSVFRRTDDFVIACRRYIEDTLPRRGENGEVIPPVIEDDFQPDDLLPDMRYPRAGDDTFAANSIRERLVVFKETDAKRMDTHENAFIRETYESIKESLESMGCVVKPGDIEIDDTGVVRYRVERLSSYHQKSIPKSAEKTAHAVEDSVYDDGISASDVKGYTTTITGYIGRILPPDEKGVVHDGHYCYVPGYTATIGANRPFEIEPYESRMILTGYKQTLNDAIRRRVRDDVMNTRSVFGDTTCLDNVLRHLYGVRYADNFTDMIDLSPELLDAIIKTNQQRVKIDNVIMDKANRAAIYQTVASGKTGGNFGNQRVGFNPLVDNDMNPVTLTVGRNVAINDAPGDGRFDHYATGNGGAQGVRYLVEGTVVTPDGRIVAVDVPCIEDENGNLVRDMSRMPRCALMQHLHDNGRMVEYDAVDRGNMTFNGLLHCIRETDRVGVAQISMGGWTFEDGLVVSKKFADQYMVPDKENPDAKRPLVKGDKIECHGNKGVISLIVDPDMSDAEAEKLGILKQVQLMRMNPDLDVVMAPYSHVSRFNSGFGAEAMGLGAEAGVDASEVAQPGDLTMPDGTVIPGALGHVRMTILEQTADEKSHFSDDGTPKRAYGAQVGWGLAAADCPTILRDSFADNTKGIVEAREMLIACGMDISADGTLMRGYHAQEGEQRNVIPLQKMDIDVVERKNKRTNDVTLVRVNRPTGTSKAFMDEIAQMGGFAEIPFQLEFPRFGMEKGFEFSQDEYTTTGYAESKCEAGKATTGFFLELPEDGEKTAGQRMFGTTYQMPVISASMRSGQEFEDGRAIYHEWSNCYKNIYTAVAEYEKELLDGMLAVQDIMNIKNPALRDAKMRHSTKADKFGRGFSEQEVRDFEEKGFAAWLDENKATLESCPGKPRRDGTYRNKYEEMLEWSVDVKNKYQRKAQTEYDKITKDIVQRKLEGKHNIFRAGIMSNKQTNSATAVWTGDPRRKLDEVGMNPDMMKALGLKAGDYCMLHRDPVLRDGGLRYMKVVPDNSLVGISVNPIGIPKSMDGDFDGDTIGVHKLSSEAAKAEAMKNLSIYANLLDCQAPDRSKDVDGNEKYWDESTRTYTRYKLFIADGQDITAGLVANPKLQKMYEALEDEVNEFENDAKAAKREGRYTPEYEAELFKKRMQAKEGIDKFVQRCCDAGFGQHIINYGSPEAHMQSILDYANDKAKGSPGKVVTYGHAMGMDVQIDTPKDGGPAKLVAVNRTEKGVFAQDVREENIGILQAKNMQVEYTGFGGMFSIRAMRALYNVEPKAALELTYMATQAVLQVKHDAVMADKYEQVLAGPARAVWQGLKLVPTTVELTTMKPTGEVRIDPKTGKEINVVEPSTTTVESWSVAHDDKGRPIKATRAEFVQQFLDVYGSDTGMGLKVNKEFVHRIADLLCEDYDPSVPVPSEPQARAAYYAKLDSSPMMNIEDEAVDKYGGVLQKLAYGAKVKDVVGVSTKKENLYDVKAEKKTGKNYNKCLDVTAGKTEKKPIGPSDVFVGGNKFVTARVKSNAVSTKKFEAAAKSLDKNERIQDTGVRAGDAERQKATVAVRQAEAAAQAAASAQAPVQGVATPVQPAATAQTTVPAASLTVQDVMSGKATVPGVFGVPGSSSAAPQSAPATRPFGADPIDLSRTANQPVNQPVNPQPAPQAAASKAAPQAAFTLGTFPAGSMNGYKPMAGVPFGRDMSSDAPAPEAAPARKSREVREADEIEQAAGQSPDLDTPPWR